MTLAVLGCLVGCGRSLARVCGLLCCLVEPGIVRTGGVRLGWGEAARLGAGGFLFRRPVGAVADGDFSGVVLTVALIENATAEMIPFQGSSSSRSSKSKVRMMFPMV